MQVCHVSEHDHPSIGLPLARCPVFNQTVRFWGDLSSWKFQLEPDTDIHDIYICNVYRSRPSIFGSRMELGKRSKVSGFFNVPTWQPYLSMFPLPNRVSYLLVFVYSPENFLISNFFQASWSFPFFCISTFQRLLIVSGLHLLNIVFMANNHKYTVTCCEFHRKFNGWSKFQISDLNVSLGKVIVSDQDYCHSVCKCSGLGIGFGFMVRS